MPRPRTSLVLVVLGALVASGCGGGGGGGETAQTTTARTGTSARAMPADQTPPSDQRGGGGATVSMRNIKYIPANVTVRRGQTVRWTNDDAVIHTVTATEGASFDSGNIEGGGRYQYKPTSTGRISYYCTIHGKQQSGTITVR